MGIGNRRQQKKDPKRAKQYRGAEAPEEEIRGKENDMTEEQENRVGMREVAKRNRNDHFNTGRFGVGNSPKYPYNYDED
jgi:hypothetical protein